MSPRRHSRRAVAALLTLALSSLAGCRGLDMSLAPIGVWADPLLAKPTSSIPIAFAVDDGPTYRIRSDGRGEYVNGQQSMTALIDEYGNLQVSVVSATPPERSLRFDYSVPADAPNSYKVDTAGTRWFRLKSNKVNNGNPGIHQMTVGSSRCYNVTVAHGNGITQYQDFFNTEANAGSTYVRITRTGGTTWTMGTGVGCSGSPDWGAVHSQDMTRKNQPVVFRGYFVLPFSISFRSLSAEGGPTVVLPPDRGFRVDVAPRGR